MKLTIDIPEDYLEQMVRDLAVSKIKQILYDWSVSDHARATLLKEWKAIEDRIVAQALAPEKISKVEESLVDKILNKLESHTDRRLKQLMRSASRRDEAPASGEGVTSRGSGSRTKKRATK